MNATLTKSIGYWIQDNSYHTNNGSGDWSWYIGVYRGDFGAEDAAHNSGCVGFTVSGLSGVISSGTLTMSCLFDYNWQGNYASWELYAVLSTSAPTANTSWRYGPTSGIISNVVVFNQNTKSLSFTLNENINIDGNMIYLYLYSAKGCDYGVATRSDGFSDIVLTYEPGGFVCFGNSETNSYDTYQVYVANGASFDLYIPYIGNGSSYDMCTG